MAGQLGMIRTYQHYVLNSSLPVLGREGRPIGYTATCEEIAIAADERYLAKMATCSKCAAHPELGTE